MRKFFRVVVFSLFLASAGTLTCAEAAFHQGDQGQDIASIQAQLNALGYNVGSVDGDFGEATAIAVGKFQRDRGLENDGVIGTDTYRAIMGREIPVSRDGSSSLVRRVVQSSLRYQGVPYVFGGGSPSGFDCSGFTRYVFAQAGIYLPRSADEQYEVGQYVSYSRLQPGDLVYFTTYEAGASHVGIYLGNGQFISATSSRGIAIARMDSGYWGDRYLGARRVL
ncbi:NlpC/P60 family protein [Pelosinus sp. sgz500959]|uniref:C40 family peptidase n=1 Tax=Pelosinus sp. sgz500959 TaxID=3242472 RepID=UPI0036719D64